MKIVIAPDSFKESLSASRAARAIARGVLEVLPDALLDCCPMADGGEGTVEAMVAATGGCYDAADVFDPLGREIRSRFGRLGSTFRDGATLPGELGMAAADLCADGEGPAGETVVIEMAAASGIQLLSPDRRDPLRTTTYGTGQLISSALDGGARRVVLGVGGSATCDAGAGAAQALGVQFFDADGLPMRLGLSGGELRDVATVDLDGRDRRLEQVELLIACDVDNPLTGPNGAATVYAPQKGATAEAVERLEEGLNHFADLLADQTGIEIRTLPGAGAAGGLGAGLTALAGARLENGGRLIADALSLPHRLQNARLCITGEGRLDSQSRHGKVPVRVQRLAAQAGLSTLCLAGTITDDAPSELFAATAALADAATPLSTALCQAEPLLQQRTAETLQRYLDGKP